MQVSCKQQMAWWKPQLFYYYRFLRSRTGYTTQAAVRAARRRACCTRREDQAANPVEHLLNALAACLTTSMVAHAAARGINIQELESEIEGDIDLNGYLGLSEAVPKGYSNIRIRFKVKTDEDNTQTLKKLAQYSPVYNTIVNGAKVDIQIEPK